MLRQQKKEAGIYSCDLKSHYDRILHAFVSLDMRRAGVSESATTSIFETIKNLNHKVRAVFGDSEKNFGDLDVLIDIN